MPRRREHIVLVALFYGIATYFPHQSNSPDVERQTTQAAHLRSKSIHAGTPTLPEGARGWDQLSPGVGCAVFDDRLMWTSDGGVGWTDITPPRSSEESMTNSFFLDAKHGWAVIVNNVATDESPSPRVVRTEDGGRIWIRGRFDKSSFPGLNRTLAFPKALWFVDRNHGWLDWKVQSSSAFDFGLLYRTRDGGKTWAELADPPNGGDMRFDSSQVGWLVGGGSNQELHVTRDGGDTWKEVSMEAPDDCDRCRPAYSLPEFRGRRDGALEVVFHDDRNLEGRHFTRTYITHNGGHSWSSVSTTERIGPIETKGAPPLVWHHCQVP